MMPLRYCPSTKILPFLTAEEVSSKIWKSFFSYFLEEHFSKLEREVSLMVYLPTQGLFMPPWYLDPIYLAFHDPSLVSSQNFSRGDPYHSQNITAFMVAIVASGEKVILVIRSFRLKCNHLAGVRSLPCFKDGLTLNIKGK